MIDEVTQANRNALPDEPETRSSDQAFQLLRKEAKSVQLDLVMLRNIPNRDHDKVTT